MQQSTTVQPATPSIVSRSSQRLMWSSAKGSRMRIQRTPGATSMASPGCGQGVAQGVVEFAFEEVHVRLTFT
jgi:hypothetical protein